MNEFCLLILKGWLNFVYVYFHIKYNILHKNSPPASRYPLFIDNSEFQPNTSIRIEIISYQLFCKNSALWGYSKILCPKLFWFWQACMLKYRKINVEYRLYKKHNTIAVAIARLW